MNILLIKTTFLKEDGYPSTHEYICERKKVTVIFHLYCRMVLSLSTCLSWSYELMYEIQLKLHCTVSIISASQITSHNLGHWRGVGHRNSNYNLLKGSVTFSYIESNASNLSSADSAGNCSRRRLTTLCNDSHLACDGCNILYDFTWVSKLLKLL